MPNRLKPSRKAAKAGCETGFKKTEKSPDEPRKSRLQMA